jgi:hypothetical protein
MRHYDAFQCDKSFVRDAFMRGEYDNLDIVGAVQERQFFQMLLDKDVLQNLAETYPTPRKKEEVPLWLYLASELTLRLHGTMGFGGYPYVLHCGGLKDVLGPNQVRQMKEPDSGQSRAIYEGFNEKNHYSRISPCDKDFLRKMAKDTEVERIERWFGTSVVREYQRMKAFDPAGIFSIDGTYLFVPAENDRYEGSSRLRFGPDGHPIDKKEFDVLPKSLQRECQWRRCYRAVTLSHTTSEKEYSLRCGVKVLPGKAAEVPEVWPIVSQFVNAVGKGVMKLLIYDRGLIDGKTVDQLKQIGVDSLFPLKHGMDLWNDAKVLARKDGKPWHTYVIPSAEPPAVPKDRPEIVKRREEKRQRTLKNNRENEEPLPPKKTLKSVEYKFVEPSIVWETCKVPVSVLLVKHFYANGDTLDWALASTKTFPDPLDMWRAYRIRRGIEEDHRQEKLFWDMSAFRSTSLSLVVNQVVFVELAYSLIQIFLMMIDKNLLVGSTRKRLLECLLPDYSTMVLYYKNYFGFFDRYELLELALQVTEGARRRLLGRTRKLRRATLFPLSAPLRHDPLDPLSYNLEGPGNPSPSSPVS